SPRAICLSYLSQEPLSSQHHGTHLSSALEESRNLPQEPAVLPRIAGISDVKATHEGHPLVSRRKRNILFPSGVKLCAQETVEQVAANHLSYFHLRGKTCSSLWIFGVTPRKIIHYRK
uniref:Uncharacterized protein n=1 Tax=Stegastes partitus TaxID=144197 RepID=A0A3B4ZKH0_9TELE